MESEIKWSQWSPNAGMFRCGRAPYAKLMAWMIELGKDAKKCLSGQEKNHAVYGMTIYDENDKIVEVRFYAETYMDDDELIEALKKTPRNVIYAAHK